jgi:hypothetical protein
MTDDRSIVIDRSMDLGGVHLLKHMPDSIFKNAPPVICFRHRARLLLLAKPVRECHPPLLLFSPRGIKLSRHRFLRRSTFAM